MRANRCNSAVLPEPLEQSLQATAAITYTEITNLAQDLSLPEDEYPLAQILEVYDDDICPLCAYLNGKIIRRGTPEWEKYRLPSHINCRRTFAYIPADADEQPDFEEPPPRLLEKYGHFHADPLKYEELRAPAFADRRQFVFRRIRDPQTGERLSVLEWNIDPLQFLDQIAEGGRGGDVVEKLFRIAHIPPIRFKPRVPESPDELLSLYREHQRVYNAAWENLGDYITQLIRREAEAQLSIASGDERSVIYLRAISSQLQAVRRVSAALARREAEHLLTLFRSPRPARRIAYSAVGLNPRQQEVLDQTMQYIRRFVPDLGVTDPVEIRLRTRGPGEAHHFMGTIYLPQDFHFRSDYSIRSMVLHEYMHYLQNRHPDLFRRMRAIHQSRTQREPLRRARDFGYDLPDHYVLKPDQYPDAYMGMEYRDNTEIPNRYFDYVFDRVVLIEEDRYNSRTGAVLMTETPDDYLNRLMSDTDLVVSIWNALHGR